MEISGNATDEEKQLGVNVFSHFVGTDDSSYGAAIGQRLKVVEMNVWQRHESSVHGHTVFETEVSRGEDSHNVFSIPCVCSLYTADMCNVLGTLHGACAALIIDPYVRGDPSIKLTLNYLRV